MTRWNFDQQPLAVRFLIIYLRFCTVLPTAFDFPNERDRPMTRTRKFHIITGFKLCYDIQIFTQIQHLQTQGIAA